MTRSTADPAWGALLAAQLAWHWDAQARPRLAGLTDDEYFFEPVPDSWSVRPAGDLSPAEPVGTGPMRVDAGRFRPLPARPGARPDPSRAATRLARPE